MSNYIRRKAYERLGTLLAMNDSRCYWCGIGLVHLKALPSANIVALDGDWALYSIDGILYRSQVATVDHVLPVSMSGDSDLQNMVPACRRCNAFRAKHDGWLSGIERCQGNGCTNQIRPQKTHCKRCWRKLIGYEQPKLPEEIRFQDRRYKLVVNEAKDQRNVVARA